MRDEESIFAEAITKSSRDERKAFLDDACGSDDALKARLEALLEAHDKSGELIDPATGGPTVSYHARQIAEGPGTVIGPYKLLQKIGEGGMGAVFMAEQEKPVRRKVALKVIKPGMDTGQVVARFEAERQALAIMDHPNIARVLDAGATDTGRPFFVMELVKGVPITEYCDKNHLTPKERLELFIPVCQAIQHAHQKGIIHRDIKPTNVLVTLHDGKPVPKAIDFGVAKAIEQRLTEKTMFTEFGQVVGTLEYMSPEQAEMGALDIDTRSDIYSLGVMLYELLTGSTPLERAKLRKAAYAEILKRIREEEPPKPSTRLSESKDSLPSISAQRKMEPARLTKLVRGDLDWIVMKSLEKDRTRRYETANGFAKDVQRYLDGDPVDACPPSATYRLKKFARKHRVALTTVGAFALLLVTATAVSVALALWANREKKRAEDREKLAIEAVKRFRDAVVESPELKNTPSLSPLRKTLLKEPLRFFKALRDQFQKDSQTRNESLERLASAVFDLGQLTDEIGDKQEAMRAYTESLAIWERLAQEDRSGTRFQREVAKSLNNIGFLQSSTGLQAEALKSFRHAGLEIRERLARGNPKDMALRRDLAESANNLGNFHFNAASFDDALTYCKKASMLSEQLAREDPTDTAFGSLLALTYNNIGKIRLATTGSEDAVEPLHKALEIRERLARENPSASIKSDLADGYHNLAALLYAMGRSADALAPAERALALYQQLARENPTVTHFLQRQAYFQNSAGLYYRDLGRQTDALRSFQEASESYTRLVHENPTITDFHYGLAASYNGIGTVKKIMGRPEEALESHLKGLEIILRLAMDYPSETLYQIDQTFSYRWIKDVQIELGRPADALQSTLCKLAVEERLAIENPTVAGHQLAVIADSEAIVALQLELGRPADALQTSLKRLAIQERLARENPTVVDYRLGLVASHKAIGDLQYALAMPVDALKSFHSALDISKRLASENPTVTDYQHRLIESYNVLGFNQRLMKRLDDALKSYQNALEVHDRLARENPNVTVVYRELASSYHALGFVLRDMGRPDDALKSFRKAVEIKERLVQENPSNTLFKIDLIHSFNWIGIVQRDTGERTKAVESWRKALEIAEKLAQENAASAEIANWVGGLLNDIAMIDLVEHRPESAREKLIRAIEAQKKVLSANPNDPNVRGVLDSSLINLKKTARVMGRDDEAANAQRDLDAIRDSDPQFAALDALLAAMLRGKEKPKDEVQRIQLADRAYKKSLHVLSARLYAEALANDPTLADDRQVWHRYDAACAAALAGSGQGRDDPSPNSAAKAKLRQQALEWLKGELATWSKILDSGPAGSRAMIAPTLRHWKEDADLAGIRDEKELAKLPELERALFKQLWSGVDQLLAKTSGGK